jgi:hypothetical protein
LGFYQRDQAASGVYRGVGVQVLKIEDDGIAEVTSFMNPDFLPRFGLPAELS